MYFNIFNLSEGNTSILVPPLWNSCCRPCTFLLSVDFLTAYQISLEPLPLNNQILLSVILLFNLKRYYWLLKNKCKIWKPRVNILAKSTLPPRGRGINSTLEKTGKKFSSREKVKKLTIFMSFWHIFPVFYEFLPYASSYLSNLTFFTQSYANHWKVFWNFIKPNFMYKMEKNSSTSSHLKCVMKIFIGAGIKRKGRN